MSFANKYLEKNFGDFLFEAPEEFPNIEFWVVIPCFNEFNLNETFHSLFNCQEPQKQIGVVVVVNDSEKTSIEIKVQNKRTLVEIDKLKNQSPKWLTIHSIYVESLPEKHAGVGWARKIGMDWVITHFNKTNNNNGIILSLDADTTVDSNYFCEIQSYFKTHPKSVAATVYFEHQIERNTQIEGILLYELYMRYYKNALEYCNFPHSIYTVGSAFTVRAKAYVAQGGMNRRKAGEDFYFLHKLMPLGKVGEINSTSVFPSSRLSDRVPFGTGPSLKKHQEGSSDLNYCYPLSAFVVLNNFFSNVKLYFHLGSDLTLSDISSNLIFQEYIKESGFLEELKSLIANCSNFPIFQIRFFHVFNAFKLLKWLNFAKTNGFPKVNLLSESERLSHLIEPKFKKIPFNLELLLKFYRKCDKARGNI